MIRFLKKHIDKFAHVGATAIATFITILALSLMTNNVVIINAITFALISAISIILEFLDEKKNLGKIDMYDAMANLLGMLIVLLMYNF